MNALAEVNGLRIEAGSAGLPMAVLDGVDLSIAPGEVVAAIGASGSGKSTLGLALAGYTRPGAQVIAGQILFAGRNLLTLPGRELRTIRGRRIAFVPQSAAAGFNPALTITRQVSESAIAAGNIGREEARRLAELLYGEFGLPEPSMFGRRYPHQVSGGQLQRAAAAMAFAGDPELIVFDEPTTALDVTTQVGVLAAFRDYIRLRKVAAFYISHDLAVVAQLADRIVVMDHGRIVDEGSVQAILGGYRQVPSRQIEPAAGLAAAKPLLTIGNLTVRYRQQQSPVLDNVSFDIRKGEIVGLIGESGSGKSTLARAIAGLVVPQVGSIALDGQSLPPDVRRRPKSLRRRIQIAFQSADVALNPCHRIRDIIGRPMTLFGQLHHLARDQAIGALLDLVELPRDVAGRFPGQLSGGQKQRVNLARALAAEPDLLICDEVTSALDGPLRDAIIDLLRRLREKRGLAMLFVTHDLSAVAGFADRLVVLQRGRVVEQGPATRVLGDPQDAYTADLIRSIPQLDPGWLDTAIALRAAAPMGRQPAAETHSTMIPPEGGRRIQIQPRHSIGMTLMILPPLSTQIVGSYTKPNWLARHQRMRALDGSWWRPEPEVLEEAKRDAARLAIYEQERAGLDIVTDGEQQRAAYDRDFLAALSGVDFTRPAVAAPPTDEHHHHRDESGWEEYSQTSRLMPTVVGPVEFQHSIASGEVLFAKSVARQPLKVAVIGPVSLSRQVADQYYHDEEALILSLAASLNAEMRALQAAGADILQIDEPSWHFNVDLAKRLGRRAIARMVEGITVPVVVHVCYGYSIVYKEKSASPDYPEVLDLLSDCPIAGISLEYEQPAHDPSILKHCGDKHVFIGLLDLGNPQVETAEHIAGRIRAALDIVPPERLHPCSDCGMWYLPRATAFGKIGALAEAAREVRREIGI